jgi:hypothetical protein
MVFNVTLATMIIPWALTLVVLAVMFSLQGVAMGVLDTGNMFLYYMCIFFILKPTNTKPIINIQEATNESTQQVSNRSSREY